jgi:hypothetical protein
MEAATAGTMVGSGADAFARERDAPGAMTEVAEGARGLADARIKHLVEWVRRTRTSAC